MSGSHKSNEMARRRSESPTADARRRTNLSLAKDRGAVASVVQRRARRNPAAPVYDVIRTENRRGSGLNFEESYEDGVGRIHFCEEASVDPAMCKPVRLGSSTRIL